MAVSVLRRYDYYAIDADYCRLRHAAISPHTLYAAAAATTAWRYHLLPLIQAAYAFH